jgi:hypothetical protein
MMTLAFVRLIFFEIFAGGGRVAGGGAAAGPVPVFVFLLCEYHHNWSEYSIYCKFVLCIVSF